MNSGGIDYAPKKISNFDGSYNVISICEKCGIKRTIYKENKCGNCYNGMEIGECQECKKIDHIYKKDKCIKCHMKYKYYIIKEKK